MSYSFAPTIKLWISYNEFSLCTWTICNVYLAIANLFTSSQKSGEQDIQLMSCLRVTLPFQTSFWQISNLSSRFNVVWDSYKYIFVNISHTCRKSHTLPLPWLPASSPSKKATVGIVIFSIVLLNTVTGLICHSHWSSYIAKTTRERKNPVKLLKTLMLDIDNWQPSHFLEWNYTLWITLMSNMQVAGNVLVLNTSYNMY